VRAQCGTWVGHQEARCDARAGPRWGRGAGQRASRARSRRREQGAAGGAVGVGRAAAGGSAGRTHDFLWWRWVLVNRLVSPGWGAVSSSLTFYECIWNLNFLQVVTQPLNPLELVVSLVLSLYAFSWSPTLIFLVINEPVISSDDRFWTWNRMQYPQGHSKTCIVYRNRPLCVFLSFEQTNHAIVLTREPRHDILSSLECNCEIIYSSWVLWKRAVKWCWNLMKMKLHEVGILKFNSIWSIFMEIVEVQMQNFQKLKLNSFLKLIQNFI
jgi:hypothetical protein